MCVFSYVYAYMRYLYVGIYMSVFGLCKILISYAVTYIYLTSLISTMISLISTIKSLITWENMNGFFVIHIGFRSCTRLVPLEIIDWVITLISSIIEWDAHLFLNRKGGKIYAVHRERVERSNTTTTTTTSTFFVIYITKYHNTDTDDTNRFPHTISHITL